jgi:hypothetical protein
MEKNRTGTATKTTTMSNKRAREDAAVDEIIGIETTDGGKVWYFHRSTLVNAGGYFTARFGDGNIPAGSERLDEHGRSVYFVERDGELFGKHIRPFILTNIPGDLPPFVEAPRLWRALRDEANFFALDGLSQFLHVTHVCDKKDPLGRGVLYYLGTNKGREDYQNPHARGAVSIGGWTEMSQQEQRTATQWSNTFPIEFMNHSLKTSSDLALKTSSLQTFVAYRPSVQGVEGEGNFFVSNPRCYIAPCDFSSSRLPVVLELTSISLCPTAYSFRYGDCYGSSYWNFEGSEDGVEWTVLHKARDDTQTVRRPDYHDDQERFDGWSKEELLSHAERNLRHTWNIELSSPRFFRFFRFIGLGMDALDEMEPLKMCLHAVGLELFGDIHEE